MKEYMRGSGGRSLRWAGSAGNRTVALAGAVPDGGTVAAGGGLERLAALRGKLSDAGYIDGAVARIAMDLCGHDGKENVDDGPGQK